MRSEQVFCGLPEKALRAFESMKIAVTYPKGTLLHAEGEDPRGVFIICKGRVKLFVSSSDGKVLILRVVEPGEVLGLSSAISGKPYAFSAEAIDSCEANFVDREDFLRFLQQNDDARFRVLEQLSDRCARTRRDIRSLYLSDSAAEKLARLLLDCHGCRENEKLIKIALTHDEIAQAIDSSRETVTRLFAELQKQHIVEVLRHKGSTLVIRDRSRLRQMAGERS
jgi:CRP/FNR family transcriptional regulator